ncbi:MAG: class I SAM-dependent methyltransferase [Novosphingobium sp.]
MSLDAARNFEPIAAHSAQARYYRFRTPYLAPVFEGLKDTLALTERSVLLDLCCGCGEVANGIKNHVRHVHAVDGSAEMLAHAPKSEKISYYEADVNKQPLPLPEIADHMLVGRALHWVEEEPLRKIISGNLKGDAHVVVLSTQWAGKDEWVQRYRSVVQRYGAKTVSSGRDFSGREKMAKLGFDFYRKIENKARFSMNMEYLLGYALANSYGNGYANVARNIKIIKDELTSCLKNSSVDERFVTTIGSWAAVYRRTR